MSQQLPEQSNSQAAAPTPRMECFLDAVCYDHRDELGSALIEVRIGVWSVWVPLSEVYGMRDKLGVRRS